MAKPRTLQFSCHFCHNHKMAVADLAGVSHFRSGKEERMGRMKSLCLFQEIKISKGKTESWGQEFPGRPVVRTLTTVSAFTVVSTGLSPG